MPAADSASETSWFERHARGTLLVFILGCIVLIVAGAEAWLTYRDDRADMDFEPGEERFIVLREFPPNASFTMKVDPHREIFRFHEGPLPDTIMLRLDAHGFVEPGRVHEQPDVSVVFMGGSTTLCRWVREDKRFPYLAGRLLEARTGLRVNAYNSSRSGNDVLFSLNKLINVVLPMRPDVVVLMHNVNDLTQLLFGTSYWDVPRPKTEPFTALKGGSYIFNSYYAKRRGFLSHTRFALQELLAPNQKDLTVFRDPERREVDADRILSDFRSSLTSFVAVSRAWGVVPVLMTQENRITGLPVDPEIWTIDGSKRALEKRGISYETYQQLYTRMNDVIREVAREQDIPLVDLDAAVPREARYVYDLVHFTQAGSEYAAEVIAGRLTPVVKGSKTPAAEARP